MKSTIDLIIAPSSEIPFCKKVKNCICINPGRMGLHASFGYVSFELNEDGNSVLANANVIKL